MKKDLNKNKDIAIKVDHVSKTFRIPHEKITSLRGAVVSGLSSVHLPILGGGQGGGSSYEEFKALEDVSFEVKKGEFFGVIGRNGSGKSTLLKILAGIYQADKGKVKVHGMISPFLELGIGFNPELSGRDNIYLNATVLGMTKKQIDKKFDDIVKFSELERFIDQKLKNYSSGMQVRLAFSVSIHANRDILLMDEVLAVGDSNFQSKCLEEFNKYRDMGRTVIIVTHDISVVERYCDRALLLRNGKIIKIGKADEVANEYIQGNIKDEELRLSSADSVKVDIVEKDEINPQKIAEITRVEFLNEEGKSKNVFETKDCVSVKIYFNLLDKKIKKINFGFGLYNLQNIYLFGISTIADNFDTENNLKNGYFQVDLKNLSLLSGTYYIKASVVGENFSSASLYAFIDKSKLFKIISSELKEGIISLDYEWK
ncbi:MAG: ABC transporter ATP-binding protein [Candidatus Moraniibacteriota bacterium]